MLRHVALAVSTGVPRRVAAGSAAAGVRKLVLRPCAVGMASEAAADRVTVVDASGKGLGQLIIASAHYPAGTVLTESACSAAEVLPSPTVHTVQVAPGAHVDVRATRRGAGRTTCTPMPLLRRCMRR